MGVYFKFFGINIAKKRVKHHKEVLAFEKAALDA